MEIILPILLTILFSAFFSGMEIAFVSSNRLKFELDKQHGHFTSGIINVFLKRPSWFIGAMLVGNNIALVLYGIFMGRLLDPWLMGFMPGGQAGLLFAQTIISTLIILVSAEFLPKTIFRINPNNTLKLFAIPLVVIYVLLYLPTLIMVGLSQVLLKLFIRRDSDDGPVNFGRIDLHHYVREFADRAESEEEIDHEIQILQNALDFSKVRVRDCMIPRTNITACSVDENIEELRQSFIDTGYSKIPIYRDSIDNIIGYTHCNELFKRPESIRSLLLPVLIVPESMNANEMLELFITKKRGLAVVVDEFGGTAGMLTIEDVIEEIFGEIEDEHDVEDLPEEQVDDDTFRLSARLEVDYLNDKYKIDLPEDEEYETLAGLILHYHEDIPEKNEVIDVNGFRFTVLDVSESRIELIKLEIMEE